MKGQELERFLSHCVKVILSFSKSICLCLTVPSTPSPFNLLPCQGVAKVFSKCFQSRKRHPDEHGSNLVYCLCRFHLYSSLKYLLLVGGLLHVLLLLNVQLLHNRAVLSSYHLLQVSCHPQNVTRESVLSIKTCSRSLINWTSHIYILVLPSLLLCTVPN